MKVAEAGGVNRCVCRGEGCAHGWRWGDGGVRAEGIERKRKPGTEGRQHWGGRAAASSRRDRRHHDHDRSHAVTRHAGSRQHRAAGAAEAERERRLLLRLLLVLGQQRAQLALELELSMFF